MMFSLASLCNPDAFKRENLNTSLQLCACDSKASYYKIIVYSFLSTVITFAGLVSCFHNQGFSNTFVHARHVLSLVKLLVRRPLSGPFQAVEPPSAYGPESLFCSLTENASIGPQKHRSCL